MPNRVYTVGILSSGEEADELPIAMPDGFVSLLGSAIEGTLGLQSLIEMTVSLGGSVITCDLNPAFARDLVAALQGAIDDAEKSAAPVG